MVNIHISSEAKEQFKSKSSVQKLKTFLKETLDTGLVTSSEYLKEGCNFDFKEEGENIYVEVKAKEYVWGNNQQVAQTPHLQQQTKSVDPRDRLKQRIKEMKDIRSGKHHKEMRVMKKNVDRNILEKYVNIYKLGINVPIPKPNELLDDPEKYRQQIELFGTGLISITKNPTVDKMIGDYFRAVAEKVGFPIMSEQQLQQLMSQQKQAPQAPPQNFDLPSNINLSNYVDSDTESESDSDSDVEETVVEETVVEETVVKEEEVVVKEEEVVVVVKEEEEEVVVEDITVDEDVKDIIV